MCQGVPKSKPFFAPLCLSSRTLASVYDLHQENNGQPMHTTAHHLSKYCGARLPHYLIAFLSMGTLSSTNDRCLYTTAAEYWYENAFMAVHEIALTKYLLYKWSGREEICSLDVLNNISVTEAMF